MIPRRFCKYFKRFYFTAISWEGIRIHISLPAVCRQFFVALSCSTRQAPNMPFYSPRPFVTLQPSERLSSEIHLELTVSFHSNGGKNIVEVARHVYSSEGRSKSLAVISVEKRPCMKFITATNSVPRIDTTYSIRVVPSAVGIFEKFTEIIEMEACTQTIPARETPHWIRTTRSTCLHCVVNTSRCQTYEELPNAMIPFIRLT